ncbi:hypothetical protein AALA24_05100 [Anaerovoracaceae bacterium 42-11]
MNPLELKMCDIQGRLFVLTAEKQYETTAFVAAFMKSETAEALDSRYNPMQWAGEEYLLDEIAENAGLSPAENQNAAEERQPDEKEMLYWTGYIYRYWHYYENIASKKIYKTAPFKVMKRNYLLFHSMDPAYAIEELKSIHWQKSKLTPR